ncbi:hypothetical protein HY792_02820 [Candidatus Desantisbacteria bacterium]|nr:hypothetical protein [Candidatus Desantisbacteria bacterium]
MKKILVSIITIAITGGVAFAADMQQEDATVGLSVPQIIELVGMDMSETVTPGPEDYARDLGTTNVVNWPSGNSAGTPNVMDDDPGKGFAERTAALEMTIFTNAQDGAALYVHGAQPATQQHILRLEDTYVSVCTEKTYILQNDLEGAYANACSTVIMETTSKVATSTQRVEDNPRNNMGGEGLLTATVGTDSGVHDGNGASVTAAYSTWLRMHNQSQHLFEVKMSTKAPRLIVINLGIADLAKYTEGEYTNTLTFTLMPIVG